MVNNKNIDTVIKLIKKEVKKYREPVVEAMNRSSPSPFRVLIGTVLSLRTRDEMTEKAASALFKKAAGPADIAGMNTKTLEKLLYPVGFYRIKAKNIKKISKILLEKYNGKVPSSIDELDSLPGVGRKTANLVAIVSFNKYGICVDTHVHKIFNRWGYISAKTPDKTEAALRKKLPKKYWKKINYYLVAFGQNVCVPVSPFCSKCPVKKYCEKKNVKNRR